MQSHKNNFNLMLKFFKKIFPYVPFFIFAIIAAGFVLAQEVKKEGKVREYSIMIASKVKNFVYYEARNHNPSGDFLPDEIDDEVLSAVKNEFKIEK